MISYGRNGRVSGVYLASRILSEKLICPDEEDLTFQDGRYSLRGLQFAAELRSDHEIMDDFRNIARNVLYLFSFCEEQPYLRVPLEQISDELLMETAGHDITGMRLLMFFVKGLIRIIDRPGETVLEAEWIVLSGIPEAEELLRNLVRVLYLFSGDTAPSRILIREKPEIGTEDLGRELSVSYDLSAQLVSEREQNIEKNVRSTLSALQKLMQDSDDISLDYRMDDSKFALRFEEGQRLSWGNYSVAVPDGFRTGEYKDGSSFVMWLPNKENPDEWEASLFSVRPGETKEPEESGAFRESYAGGILNLDADASSDASGLSLNFRIVGVSENRIGEARAAARLILDTVHEEPHGS